jgi:tetratricopeptide (TPR) repeat protein
MRIGHEVETGKPAVVRTDVCRLGVLTLVLALLAGCAHEKAYKRGDRLSREGQYEQAVAELENAIRLAEENNHHKAAEKYREKLEQVKLQAGQFFHRDARIRFDRADLGGARDAIEQCVKFWPQEPSYWSFRQRVLQAIAEAEKVRTEALSLADQQQWQAAVQRMNEALAMNRTLPGGDADLKQIKYRAYRHYLDLANEKLREGNLAEAESQARAALVYQEAGQEAKTLLQTVKDRREAAVLIARGRTLLDQGNPEEALAALEQAAQLHPTHPDLSELLGRARPAVCDRWLRQGRAAVTAGNYPAAMRLFQKSQGLLEGYGGVDALLAEVRSRLAGLHLEASRQYQQDGAAGIATFHAAAALSYLPEHFNARRQLGQCVEQVRQEVAYTIAFTSFKSTPEQQLLAAVLDAGALEHLAKAHPANVVIVERADFQASVEGILPAIRGRDALDTVAAGRIDPQSHVAMGQLQGVDALIVGQVLESKVTSQSRQTGHGETTYQDGYRREPNPDHVAAAAVLDAAVDALDHARQRLGEAEARLARYKNADPANTEEMARKRKAQADVDECKQRLVNAAADVGTAKIRLAAIPPEVLVPNMVKHQYPIETFTWTAKVACMVKMLDTATGEVLLAERVEGQAEHSDRMVQADVYRNVPEDPLVLPSESTLLEGAASSAIAKLRQTLNQACAKHGQRFLVQMQRAEAAGDTVRAVDNRIKYLFAYPAGDTHTQAMVEFLRKYLADEDGLVDVRGLLRTYCQVLLRK